MDDPAGTRHILAWVEEPSRSARSSPTGTFTYGIHPGQRVERWKGRGRGTVVSIHGGAFVARIDLTSHHPLCEDLRSRGFDVHNAEYRGTGFGSRAGDTFCDARSAVAAVVERLAGGVVLFGHSAGGFLAEWAADVAGVEASLALAPVTDIRRWADETSPDAVVAWAGGQDGDWEKDARRWSLDPARDVPAQRVLFHGTADRVVPLGITEDDAERVVRAGCAVRLARLDGEGHFAVTDPREPAFELVATELGRLVER